MQPEQATGGAAGPLLSFLLDTSPRKRRLFLVAALLVTLVYGMGTMIEAFGGDWVVQDDARQHVFWMAQLKDPSLFPDCLIVSYFKSVAPVGYVTVFRVAEAFGISPLVFSKVLPLVLALVTVFLAFEVCLLFLPFPATAFVAAALINDSLWLDDTVVTATPRAYAFGLLLAMLLALGRNSRWGTLLVLALQAVFYFPLVVVSLALMGLRLISLRGWRPVLSSRRGDYLLLGAGVLVGLAILLPHRQATSHLGPMRTLEEARGMAEFQPGGRSPVFSPSAFQYWMWDGRTGFLPGEACAGMNPLIWLGLLLALLLHRRLTIPCREQVVAMAGLLLRLLIVSAALFLLAHLLLFRLYLPSRYIRYSLVVALNLTSALSLTLVVHSALHHLERPGRVSSEWRLAGPRLVYLLIPAVLLLGPLWRYHCGFPVLGSEYVRGREPALYEFLAARPADCLVASLSLQADDLPIFTRRRVLVAREFMMPMFTGYYDEFSQRVNALIEAQYTSSSKVLLDFIARYEVSYLLLDRGAFDPGYLRNHSWARHYQPACRKARRALEEGRRPVLVSLIDACSVFSSRRLVLLDCRLVAREASRPRR